MESEALDSESAMDAQRLDSGPHMGSDGADSAVEGEQGKEYDGIIRAYEHSSDYGFINCSSLRNDVYFCWSDLPRDFSAGRDGFCDLVGFDVTFRLHKTPDRRLRAKHIQVMATGGKPLMGIVTSVFPEEGYGLIVSSAVKGDVSFVIKGGVSLVRQGMLVGRHVRFEMVHDEKDGDKQKAVACTFKPVMAPTIQSQMMQMVNRMKGKVGAAGKGSSPCNGVTKPVDPPPVTESEATEAECSEVSPLPADDWWTCRECNFQNHEFDLNCQKCQAPWSHEGPSSEQSAVASTPAPVARPTLASTPAPVGKGGGHIPMIQLGNLGWSIAMLRSEMTAMTNQNQGHGTVPGMEATGETLDAVSGEAQSYDHPENSGTEATGEMLDATSIGAQSCDDYENSADYMPDVESETEITETHFAETPPCSADEWWTCSQCKFQNHEFELNCEKCQAPWSPDMIMTSRLNCESAVASDRLDMESEGEKGQQYDGTIRNYKCDKNYGFISCSELPEDVYFSWQDLPSDFCQGRDGFCVLTGFNVTFHLQKTPDGKLRANFIQVVPTEGKPLMGIIKSIFPDKGYGFIISSAVQGDVFFLKSEIPLQTPLNTLVGRHVRFEILQESSGKRKAVACALKPPPTFQGDEYLRQVQAAMQIFHQMKGTQQAIMQMGGAPGKGAGSFIFPTKPFGAQSQYSHSKTLDPASAAKSETTETSLSPDDWWTCSACNFQNHEFDLNCQKCQAPWQVGGAASPSSDASRVPAGAGGKNQQDPMWMLYAKCKEMMNQTKGKGGAPGKAGSPRMPGVAPPVDFWKRLDDNGWVPPAADVWQAPSADNENAGVWQTSSADDEKMAPPPGDWTVPADNEDTCPPDDDWGEPPDDDSWTPDDDEGAAPPGDWQAPPDDDRRTPPPPPGPPGNWGTPDDDEGTPPPGDWRAPAAADDDERAPPPGDWRMPPPDDWWICSECNFRNREFHAKCQRCQAPWPKRPRPSSVASNSSVASDRPRLPVKPPPGPPPARLLQSTPEAPPPPPPPPPPPGARSQKAPVDGIVKMVNPKERYGFLTSPGVGADVPFDFQDVIGGVELWAGQPVSFNLQYQEDRKPVARDIKVIKFR